MDVDRHVLAGTTSFQPQPGKAFKIVSREALKDAKYLKFGFSEKATKFERIFVVLLTRASCSVRATEYLSKS